MLEKLKDRFPQLSPIRYSVNAYAKLSGHVAHRGCGFPCAVRCIDVSKVMSMSHMIHCSGHNSCGFAARLRILILTYPFAALLIH